ncbi:MAG: BppU family phage baseplate upper protein [Clostridium sp.]|nr:BppU family phage baseplate upper protein [Clostridium sp.]
MNTKIIKLDINRRLYDKIVAKQDDTGSRFLLFQLLDGAVPFNLTDRSVRVYGVKPDGAVIFNDLTVTHSATGFCLLELTNQMLAIAGTVKLELMITEGDKKLTSIPFEMEVIKKINSNAAVESSNEFRALLNALKEIDEWNKEFADKSGKLEELYTPRLNELGSQLETKEHKMKFINVPNNSDLAEYFKNVDTIGTHRVLPGTGVTNTCNDASSAYSFYYVYQTFVLGITDGGRLFKASFVNKTLGAWEEILTNKKISFKLTPKAGFAIAYQNCYAINNIVYINARFQMTDGSLFQPTSGNRELATIPTKYCPTDATALQSWAASASTIGLPGGSSAAAVPDGRILAVNTGTPKTITVSGVYFI